MRRMSGPITVERIINMFFNIIIWRTLNMVVSKLFNGVGKLAKRITDKPKPADPALTDQRAEPLDTLDQGYKTPEINDFRSSAKPKNPLR